MLDMGYYEVLSGFKFTVIMSRIAQAMIEWGLLEADSDFPSTTTPRACSM
jgi:hypothetical protein